MLNQEKAFSDIIKEILRSRSPRMIPDEDSLFRHAAVLIPLFIKGNASHVLLTKRTNRVEEHKGQISFPGGHVEDGDSSPRETALREAYEEVGIQREDVHVLGRADDAGTLSSNFIVHPFVGFISYPYPFRINAQEVRHIIEVPLRVFTQGSPEDHLGDVEYGGRTYHGIVYPCDGGVIWGATARIMENLVQILGNNLNLPGDGE